MDFPGDCLARDAAHEARLAAEVSDLLGRCFLADSGERKTDLLSAASDSGLRPDFRSSRDIGKWAGDEMGSFLSDLGHNRQGSLATFCKSHPSNVGNEIAGSGCGLVRHSSDGLRCLLRSLYVSANRISRVCSQRGRDHDLRHSDSVRQINDVGRL